MPPSSSPANLGRSLGLKAKEETLMVSSTDLEKEMATHSSILAWKIPWMRSLVGYSPWGHKESDTTEQLHLLTYLRTD